MKIRNKLTLVLIGANLIPLLVGLWLVPRMIDRTLDRERLAVASEAMRRDIEHLRRLDAIQKQRRIEELEQLYQLPNWTEEDLGRWWKALLERAGGPDEHWLGIQLEEDGIMWICAYDSKECSSVNVSLKANWNKPGITEHGVEPTIWVVTVSSGTRSVQGRYRLLGSYREQSQTLIELAQYFYQLSKGGENLQRAWARVFFVLGGMAIAGSVILAYLVSRPVISKIENLAAASRRIGEPDLGLEVRGSDEIDQFMSTLINANKELNRSRERVLYLERAEMWQDMARRIAHEIKNPLTPMRLMLDNLTDAWEEGGEPGRRTMENSVEIIREELDNLNRWVATFSEFGRLPKPERERVDIGEELRRALESHPEWQTKAQIEIIDNDRDHICDLDRALFRRVIVNLVDNSLEAGGDGTRIAFCLQDIFEHVHLVYEDDAGGINIEHERRVFEPYFTTKRKGTGLGLAMVRKTLLEHGGEVELRNRPGEGVTIVMQWPRKNTEKSEKRA